MKKRFTLIELLIVVAIIGILAAILLPVLNRTKEKARRALCLANISQLSKVAIIYTDDNNSRFTARNNLSSGYAAGYHDDGGSDHWGLRWDSYIPELDFDGDGSPILFCPSIPDSSAWTPDYVSRWRCADYSFWPGMPEKCDTSGVFNWVMTNKPTMNINIADPEMPLFGDAAFEYQKQGYQWFVVAHPYSGGGKNSYDEPDRDVPRAGYPEGFQQSLADGSSHWVPEKEMERAMKMNWGADGGNSYQWLSWP